MCRITQCCARVLILPQVFADSLGLLAWVDVNQVEVNALRMQLFKESANLRRELIRHRAVGARKHGNMHSAFARFPQIERFAIQIDKLKSISLQRTPGRRSCFDNLTAADRATGATAQDASR